MALANSVDPYETPHDAASHQGLRCLLIGISCWNRILKAFANSLDPDENVATFVVSIDGEEHHIIASATLVEALNSDGKVQD
ncbi:hypothetical protein DPMN_048487 [Dreissena polymorpha]|uniref:Uncharacterized protein n=1 Tax=Dreissena polymorpha TaxID=45954 RepID=A0A9D4I415_DREPO|nr:hypothetical protein DPMN_048487 [Dreissena polymorpha]